jgi:hypothetical protein
VKLPRYVESRFKTDVRMLPQFGPLEVATADTLGKARNGSQPNAGSQHSRGEMDASASA